MTIRGCSFLAATVVALAASGCAATATFHSRTGAELRPIARRALVIPEDEARLVTAAGGVVIGSINAKALAVNASADDVTEEAAEEAAKNGGTHIVLTDKGVDFFTVNYPEEQRTRCRDAGDGEECRTTYVPPTSRTYEKPTERFVVIRVPVDRWSKLPEDARPVAGKP